MKLKNKLIAFGVAILAAFSFVAVSQPIRPISATSYTYGPDWSKYQGNYGLYGTSKDKFVIAQVGGVYAGYGYVDQATYKTQVASAIAAGKHAHTYIWYQVGGSTSVAKAALDRFLPMVQTPKGSIVALDYEAGASSNKQANTNAILYGMARIKAAGYTPVLYSGKYYLNAHTYYSQINAAYPTSLWLAGYPLRGVQTMAPFQYFPSYDGVAIWQFTDAYGRSGLDGSVDLTGITDNGYGRSTTTDTGKVIVKPDTKTPATNAGQSANNTHKSSISAGYAVKVNLSAKRYSNGTAIPNWVKGRTYKVIQTSGNKVLLGSIMSWVNRSDVEILQTASQARSALTVDGYWGREVTAALQRHEGTTVDGIISGQIRTNNVRGVQIGRGGSRVIAAMQQNLGVRVDGYLGPQTIKAMQRALGTKHDGVISNRSRMVIVLQERLNAGTLPF
ncbi:GH25 family lysozyme [Lacticaseibacillus suibinensis]|uniref:GH25 family lysozyme n=1 Tax=Lacticaseibacillus suibinensis TaxID=2486011 RepID=UPI001942BDEC|nr:GH25 family lysozyme [Lacticaseibacillus suibinensis]